MALETVYALGELVQVREILGAGVLSEAFVGILHLEPVVHFREPFSKWRVSLGRSRLISSRSMGQSIAEAANAPCALAAPVVSALSGSFAPLSASGR